jgi:hypothetical protein
LGEKIILQAIKTQVFTSLLVIILTAPLLFSTASAQAGTGYWGLDLNPSKGVGGTQVEVSLNIATWTAQNGDKASVYLYKGTNFTLVWDIGGWDNSGMPASYNTIEKTLLWKIIGTANIDNNGLLKGTVTIPAEASGQIGEHVIYAIWDQGLGSTKNFWWGFFEILPGGAVTSLSPSPSAPSPSPSSHPEYCTLIVNWTKDDFEVYVDGEWVGRNNAMGERNDSYSNTYRWGTIVHLSASYDGNDDSLDWGGWSIVDSKGRHEAPGPEDIDLLMDEDKSAEPKTQNSGSAPFGIPGFPFESIAIGFLLALGLLFMVRKKSRDKLLVPK